MRRSPKPLDWRDIPGAPPPGSVLMTFADLRDGASEALTFRDGDSLIEIFLIRKGTEVYGYLNSCPHARLPLDWTPGRFLDMSGTRIVCHNHGAHFEIGSGRCIAGPCKGDHLTPVRLEVDGEEIRVPEIK